MIFKDKLAKTLLVFSLIAITNTTFAKSIDEVSKSMNLSVSDARIVLQSTYTLIKEIQNNISSIASNTYEYKHKTGDKGLIKQTIKHYFSSSSSIVEVSSLTTRRTTESTIYNYLNRLANFSRNGIYDKIQIRFGKTIHFGRIYTENDKIKINAEAWQLFEGCKNTFEGIKCYSDMTKKTFVVKVEHGLAVIDSIKVKETLRVDDTKVDLGY